MIKKKKTSTPKNRKKDIKDVNTLVFQGGGAKGIIYVGVIKALEDNDILKQIDFLCGSSIGALACFLIYLGYDTSYIIKWIVSNTFVRSIFGKDDPFCDSLNISSIFTAYKDYGVYDSDALLHMTHYHVKHSPLLNGKGRGTETFKDLYLRSGGKIFACTGTNMNRSRVYYFSYMTTPNMPVFLAMAITMCVPFIFTPIEWAGAFWVDGGLIDNLPYPWVRHFRKKENVFCFGFINQNCVDCGCGEECINDHLDDGGLHCNDNYDTPYGKPPQYKKYTPYEIPINNFLSYLQAFLKSVEKEYKLQPHLKCHSLFFTCDEDLSTLDFNLDYYTKKKYIHYGYEKTEDYINKFKSLT